MVKTDMGFKCCSNYQYSTSVVADIPHFCHVLVSVNFTLKGKSSSQTVLIVPTNLVLALPVSLASPYVDANIVPCLRLYPGGAYKALM